MVISTASHSRLLAMCSLVSTVFCKHSSGAVLTYGGGGGGDILYPLSGCIWWACPLPEPASGANDRE